MAQEASPRALSNPDPEYPVETATLGFGGEVKVWAKVNKQGKVSVVRAAGPVAPCSDLGNRVVGRIREAAVQVAKRTMFEPTVKDGKPQEVELVLTYLFDRDGKPFRPGAIKPGLDPSARIIEAGVLQGRIKHLARPDYRASARASRITGTIPVSVLVGTDGKIIAAAALGGHRVLQDPAVVAACASSIEPVQLSGVPVQVTGVINYAFLP